MSQDAALLVLLVVAVCLVFNVTLQVCVYRMAPEIRRDMVRLATRLGLVRRREVQTYEREHAQLIDLPNRWEDAA